jgi:ribulose-5-phosphate 4-epimerase/fuculose-1-phosphate aldolase
VRFVTLEQGTYGVGPGYTDDDVCARAFERIAPLAASRLVITNDIRADLPEPLWHGDKETHRMLDAGRALDDLDLLPSPFPLERILEPRELRHVQLLYGIGGLSYGNVSARFRGTGIDAIPEPDGPLFWMSASGVDKSDLRNIGEHILLVRGYDAEQDAMILSVPPDVPVKRVSVDAIEHWMIYREHPDVGAILHVHGWIDGTPSTDVNYPCGTLDLASAVAELVRGAPATSTSARPRPRTIRPSGPLSSATTGAAHAPTTMMIAAPDNQVTSESATPKKPNCRWLFASVRGNHTDPDAA